MKTGKVLRKKQHSVRRWIMDDNLSPTGIRLIGYKCSCGGFWYLYQNPHHNQ
jgi:hypothetical protein